MAKEGNELFRVDDQIKEANLSSFLFGNKTEVLEKIGEETSAFQHKHRIEDDSDDEENEGKEKREKLKPAWTDHDDLVEFDLTNSKHKKYKVALDEKKISGTELSERLRGTMKSLLKGESDWASLENKVEEGVLSGITELRGTSKVLAPTFINTIRLNDANADSPQWGIQCVNFNSTGELLLSTGSDHTVKLFRVDGDKNKLIQSIKVPKMVLHYSQFALDSSYAVICGESSCCIFDFSKRKLNNVPLPGQNFIGSLLSPSGEFLGLHSKGGVFLLMSMITKKLLEKIRFPEKEIACFTFSPDSKTIYFSGLTGSIFLYNTGTRRFDFRFKDEGSSSTTCLAVSPNNEYLVTGLDSGHVNIYSVSSCRTVKAPTPLATLGTIRTAITTLLFNHDTQILLVSSNLMAGAVRLIHIPTFSIFENFPPAGPRRAVKCAAFSPTSGFLVCGTEAVAEMYRLPHFSNA